MPVKVILDSNFLMIPSQFRIDIFSELRRTLNRRVQIIVLSPVRDELRRISLRGNPKTIKQAERALKIIDDVEVVDIKHNPGESVDDLIIRVAKEWNCPVATNDGELRKRLKDIGVSVIYLRQGVHLETEGILS